MKLQSISAVILALLASGCSSVISKVFPLDDLPSPTGPHAVGTQFFEWVDEARDELFTDDPSDQRRLAGQVWYPATATSDAARQPYLDGLDGMLKHFERLFFRIGPIAPRTIDVSQH